MPADATHHTLHCAGQQWKYLLKSVVVPDKHEHATHNVCAADTLCSFDLHINMDNLWLDWHVNCLSVDALRQSVVTLKQDNGDMSYMQSCCVSPW